MGARHGRVVTNAVRSPARPATRGKRVVSRASARLIAGTIVMIRRAESTARQGAEAELERLQAELARLRGEV